MIRVRSLRLGDYRAMMAVWRAAGLGVRPLGRDSRAAIAIQLRKNRGLYLGAFDGPRLVGLVLATHDTRKGWINRLAVRPEYQRRGLATRLVRAAERALFFRGIRLVAVLVDRGNARSLRLFRGLGYEVYPVHYLRKKRMRRA